MTNKLVFGLEFFIAADVLRTLRDPTQEELILLGDCGADKDNSRVLLEQGSYGISSGLKKVQSIMKVYLPLKSFTKQ